MRGVKHYSYAYLDPNGYSFPGWDYSFTSYSVYIHSSYDPVSEKKSYSYSYGWGETHPNFPSYVADGAYGRYPGPLSYKYSKPMADTSSYLQTLKGRKKSSNWNYYYAYKNKEVFTSYDTKYGRVKYSYKYADEPSTDDLTNLATYYYHSGDKHEVNSFDNRYSTSYSIYYAYDS